MTVSPEFDALFIRETDECESSYFSVSRSVLKPDGLVVIDDPLSILRCTNKGPILKNG